MKPAVFNKANGLFKYFLKGKSYPFLSFPDNAPKATNDPVNVMAPTPAPRYAAVLCRLSGVGWIMKEAMDVVTAATPTSAWKAATV